jgi:hypothetical protein
LQNHKGYETDSKTIKWEVAMKLRWWILGTAAAITGAVFVVKHFVDDKTKMLHFIDSGNEKNFGAFPPEIPETEFDGADFLV